MDRSFVSCMFGVVFSPELLGFCVWNSIVLGGVLEEKRRVCLRKMF